MEFAQSTVSKHLGILFKCGLLKFTIGSILKASDLKPHREDGFRLSNDLLFVEKVYDVVVLYLYPPGSAVVLSVDETPRFKRCLDPRPLFR